ncbi:hypothetical protein T11_1996 [Trichinella zimbabwensis]|uniref:Uncharacterized protein n=1 Tax=Trichinella zimbabwensis TaxID=268475 RepID=A0A0V1HFI5_9BILA|nr:hypothetical protein T11_1996 [Trichinella zimbabwensis]
MLLRAKTTETNPSVDNGDAEMKLVNKIYGTKSTRRLETCPPVRATTKTIMKLDNKQIQKCIIK